MRTAASRHEDSSRQAGKVSSQRVVHQGLRCMQGARNSMCEQPAASGEAFVPAAAHLQEVALCDRQPAAARNQLLAHGAAQEVALHCGTHSNRKACPGVRGYALMWVMRN